MRTKRMMSRFDVGGLLRLLGAECLMEEAEEEFDCFNAIHLGDFGELVLIDLDDLVAELSESVDLGL